jgi:hypothetical protein
MSGEDKGLPVLTSKLMQEVRARKVRHDGIHFLGLRYLSLTQLFGSLQKAGY